MLGSLNVCLCRKQGVDGLAEGGRVDESFGGGGMVVLTLETRVRLSRPRYLDCPTSLACQKAQQQPRQLHDSTIKFRIFLFGGLFL